MEVIFLKVLSDTQRCDDNASCRFVVVGFRSRRHESLFQTLVHDKVLSSNFGEVVNVELSMDRVVQFPKGDGYVEFKTRSDAEKALIHMNGGQVDGNVVSARFTLPQRTKVSPPPRAVVAPNKREPSMRENTAPDTIKDGAVHRRESPPPRRKSHSPQRRSPINRRGDSPPRCRGDSPPRRHSPLAFRHRNRSPIKYMTSPRRVRGSPAGRHCLIDVDKEFL